MKVQANRLGEIGNLGTLGKIGKMDSLPGFRLTQRDPLTSQNAETLPIEIGNHYRSKYTRITIAENPLGAKGGDRGSLGSYK